MENDPFHSLHPLSQVPQFWVTGENSIENEFGDPENLKMDIHTAFDLILTISPSLRYHSFEVRRKIVSELN